MAMNTEGNRNRQILNAEQSITQLMGQLRQAGLRQLPTESELIEKLGLSRYTLREAVQSFVARGELERIQGKGTFIVDGRTDVSFSGWIGTEPPGNVAVEQLTGAFNEDRAAYSVSYTPIPYLRTAERILDLAMHGAAPDVMQVTPPIAATLHDLGALLPLDEHVNQGDRNRRYLVDVESGYIGKETYTVTWGLAPLILYYNRNVLAAAGLDPNRPPATLDDLLQACVRINARGNPGMRGTSLPLSFTDPSFLWLYPYLLAFGGGFVDRETGTIVIDSAGNVEALRWLARLQREGSAPGSRDVGEGRMLFAADRIGFWVDGPWLRGLFRQMSGLKRDFDQHYGVALFPVGPSGRSESVLWNHGLAISAQCRNIEAALEWIEFLTTEEKSAQCLFKVLGMLPPLRDFLQTSCFSEDPFAHVCIAQMDTVSCFPISHPLFTRSMPFMSQVFAGIIARDEDPPDRLAILREIIQIINRNRQFDVFTQ
jgi:multiple sugar transport system substrate-binding protein